MRILDRWGALCTREEQTDGKRESDHRQEVLVSKQGGAHFWSEQAHIGPQPWLCRARLVDILLTESKTVRWYILAWIYEP